MISTSLPNDNEVRRGFVERDWNRVVPSPFAERSGLRVAFLGHINDARRQRQDGHSSRPLSASRNDNTLLCCPAGQVIPRNSRATDFTGFH